MEPVGAFSDGEWDAFLGNISSGDRNRLNDPSWFPEASHLSFSLNNANLLYPSNASCSKMQYNSLEASQRGDFSSRAFTATTWNQKACYLNSSSKLFPVENDVNRMAETSEHSKKKPRVSKDVQGNEKIKTNCAEQSSSSNSSEDENASLETNGSRSTSNPKAFPALNLNGATRAGRGSATDPQSVYARKRRERINERLRTLQNLIPNGTKVDISTMLEEAVSYVKFLQLQIKLLSSDDLWMYAPLAFNGIDIGLDRKLSEFL